tara:strand:+ start:4556 stop:4912 length:357 start_codon:yes stop_codon:yes gene_type:complete
MTMNLNFNNDENVKRLLLTYEDLDTYFINDGLDTYDESILDEVVFVDVKVVEKDDNTIEIHWDCDDVNCKGIIYTTNKGNIMDLINTSEYETSDESDDTYDEGDSESDSEEDTRSLSP